MFRSYETRTSFVIVADCTKIVGDIISLDYDGKKVSAIEYLRLAGERAKKSYKFGERIGYGEISY